MSKMTAGDMFKPKQTAYFQYVQKVCKRIHNANDRTQSGEVRIVGIGRDGKPAFMEAFIGQPEGTMLFLPKNISFWKKLSLIFKA